MDRDDLDYEIEKRDQFALMAMRGLIDRLHFDPGHLAQQAYLIADQMLEVRRPWIEKREKEMDEAMSQSAY